MNNLIERREAWFDYIYEPIVREAKGLPLSSMPQEVINRIAMTIANNLDQASITGMGVVLYDNDGNVEFQGTVKEVQEVLETGMSNVVLEVGYDRRKR